MLVILGIFCIFYLQLLGSVLPGVLDHGYHCNDWSNIFLNGIKTAIWSLNLNLTVTMANTKFLNNINFWSGNPGKTFLVYTFGWG